LHILEAPQLLAMKSYETVDHSQILDQAFRKAIASTCVFSKHSKFQGDLLAREANCLVGQANLQPAKRQNHLPRIEGVERLVTSAWQVTNAHTTSPRSGHLK
jgi:hypothetical protein